MSGTFLAVSGGTFLIVSGKARVWSEVGGR